ncbi:hypothetical protein [Micromonospora sp. NPDC126480]|uniref:hypothetical protein n=1 Tax=Micromonospora sp. NPDC126480 TaxID=3155312 RepID=UPI003325BCF7
MQPSRPEPTPQRSIWMWAGAAAGLALAVLMFLNSGGGRVPAAANQPVTDTFAVSGTVVLGAAAAFIRDDHGGCAGTGAHADVVDGALVLVAAAGGLAAGKLTEPQALPDGTCRFRFSVDRVPAGQDAYLIMVADREPRQLTEPELTGPQLSLRID